MARTPSPIHPRRTDERAYEAALRRSYVNPMFQTLRRRLAQAEAATQAFRAMDQVVEDMLAKPRNGVPVSLIQEHLDRMRGYHRKRVINSFRAALGLDVGAILSEPDIAAFMTQKISDNVDLIKTIPVRSHAKLKQKLEAALASQPFDQQMVSRIVATEFQSTGYNLRRITRDQTSKTIGGLTEIRHRQLGVGGYEWLTSQDERVRPTHRAKSGLYFPWSQPPSDTGHPGQDIQCFPGSVRVAPIGLEGSVAYCYVGELVEITLANGVDVAVTPNHPVGTKAGWKRAGLLDEGDEVFVHEGSRSLAVRASDPHIAKGYPCAEDLHRFLGGLGDLSRALGRGVDLHGHAAARDEKIDVVHVESILRDRLDALARQMFADLGLELPDLDRSMALLPPLGGGAQGFPVFSFVPAGRIGIASEFAALGRGQAGHAEIVRLAPGAWCDADLMETPHDEGAVFVDPSGHLKHRNAFGVHAAYADVVGFPFGLVECVLVRVLQSEIGDAGRNQLSTYAQLAGYGGNVPTVPDHGLDHGIVLPAPFAPVRVTRVARSHHDGPVYSFDSQSEGIIANGILFHNCRCVAVAVVRDAERQALQARVGPTSTIPSDLYVQPVRMATPPAPPPAPTSTPPSAPVPPAPPVGSPGVVDPQVAALHLRDVASIRKAGKVYDLEMGARELEKYNPEGAATVRKEIEILSNTARDIQDVSGLQNVAEALQDTFSEARTAQYMAIKETNLRKVINEGFKNSYETGKGTFKTIGEDRFQKIEKPVFGLAEDALDRPSELPKYGFIAGKENMDWDRIVGHGYGETFVRFKPEVRQRSSITYTDSFDGNSRANRFNPSMPLNDIDDDFLAGTTRNLHSEYEGFQQQTRERWQKWAQTRDYKDLADAGGQTPYVETQIFGKLDMSDVDAVIVESKKAAVSLRRALDRAGYKDTPIVPGQHHTRLQQIWRGFSTGQAQSVSLDDIDRLGDAWLDKLMVGGGDGLLSPNWKNLPASIERFREEFAKIGDWRKAPNALKREYLKEYTRLIEKGAEGGLPKEHWKHYRKSKAGFTEDVINTDLLETYE